MQGIKGVRFKRVIMDERETDRGFNPPQREEVKRLVMCSGKVSPGSYLLRSGSQALGVQSAGQPSETTSPGFRIQALGGYSDVEGSRGWPWEYEVPPTGMLQPMTACRVCSSEGSSCEVQSPCAVHGDGGTLPLYNVPQPEMSVAQFMATEYAHDPGYDNL